MSTSDIRRKTTNGFTLVQVVIALAALGLLALLVGSMLNSIGIGGTKSKLVQTAANLSSNMRNLIVSPSAWSTTLQNNPGLACLADPAGDCTGNAGGAIDIFNTSGQAEFTSSVPTAGFSADGQPCNTYDAANGNDACPFRMQTEWTPGCPVNPATGAPFPTCRRPQALVTSTMSYRPRNAPSGIVFNSSAYNVRLNVNEQPGTAADMCVAMGGTWDAGAGRCDMREMACTAIGGTWDTSGAAPGCRLPITAQNCGGSSSAIKVVTSDTGGVSFECGDIDNEEEEEDEIDPVLVAGMMSSGSRANQYTPEEVLGCNTSGKSGSFENGRPCVQDKPLGTKGTCYFRVPAKKGPASPQSGWFMAGVGPCDGGIYVDKNSIKGETPKCDPTLPASPSNCSAEQ